MKNSPVFKTIDGCEAAAYVAFRLNEAMAIYPITPSSPIAEWCDQWASEGKKNIWDTQPAIIEMQSEGGAVGAVHGMLQTGSISTTFTASQGLLLMIPNMFKFAGELLPTVFHVTARTVATHALSIFGDHSDIMACRSTGWGMLGAASVQETMDFALVSQAASLRSRLPFIHFFDGFRTSHEVSKIEMLDESVLRALIDDKIIAEIRARAMSPDKPVLRGTAQNPDVFFQGREAANSFYSACPDIVQKVMDELAEQTGRKYKLFDYVGAPDAENVIVLMGSGCEAAEEAVEYLNLHGAKVGVLKVRLYRPFDGKRFVEALPPNVRKIAVLDRTKEPGATGEPLYQDCLTAILEELAGGRSQLKFLPKVITGRYGLSSKEFTPAMVKAVFDNLASDTSLNHFTVGINDDVSHTSLKFDPEFSTESDKVVRALFYGLGADGTVGANKNSIKIIGEETDNYAQGYFVYDSKKSGSMTVSHLRFGPKPIHSTYLISSANFIACHLPGFLDRYEMLRTLVPGGTFLLNTPHSKDEIWANLPSPVQISLLEKKAKFFVIDATKVARDSGMGGRINTIMQVCFFALSGVLPKDEAIEAIKKSIKKTYGKKGEEVVKMNLQAVDNTLAHLHEVPVLNNKLNGTGALLPPISPEAPEFVRNILGQIASGFGDDLPVSAFPIEGSFPTGTAQFEKRNLAVEIPVWDEKVCIQCLKCVAICPHATIRAKVYDAAELKNVPASFKVTDARVPEFKGMKFSLQVAAEDCTGCSLCVDVCPAKNKTEVKLKAINMRPQAPLRAAEHDNWNFFLTLPEFDRRKIKTSTLRQQQILQPLFEFSGACAGCGETPYIKMLTQLFGDRAVIANATGCSSIYGGNLPTTPYTKNAEGRGPTWCNSLFEDNAEFGLGFRVSIDKQKEFAEELVKKLASRLGDELVTAILQADQSDEAGIYDQRERVVALKQKLASIETPEAKLLLGLADQLVKKSVWILGGDGWAYDIGYGGLDHVLASGRKINVLVMDTEVYSNTGGQMSKSTPRGAVAKFAAGGKPAGKKDLGLIAMSYGNIYVASVAMGAKDEHTLKAFVEAESFPGPSLIIAYSHCIAHGIAIDTGIGARQQKLAVESGQWLLYRYDPRRAERGENPLQVDSSTAKSKVKDFMMTENRFKMLTKSKPDDAKKFFEQSQADADRRWKFYSFMAARDLKPGNAEPATLKPVGTADQQPCQTPSSKLQAPEKHQASITKHGAWVQDWSLEFGISLELGAWNLEFKIMDLTTHYLGLKLSSPLVVSGSPLSEDVDNIKRMEDAGAAAVVLYSLFEEQLRQDRLELNRNLENGTNSFAEALSYFPEPDEFCLGPEEYLKHIAEAKKATHIPIIASLNGSSVGGWTSYAKQIQQAGADALELNIYSIPTDMDLPGAVIEDNYINILRAVKSEVTIPVAVKLSPFFSNFANMAKRFDQAGANGLVLFNRFYQPDIELESLEVKPNILLSTPMAMRLPLRWIALLHGKVNASLAATSGIHRASDVLKMLLVGADVTMLCSTIIRNGIPQIAAIQSGLADWLEEHEYESISQMKGSLSQKNCAEPAAFERAQYMKALTGFAMPRT